GGDGVDRRALGGRHVQTLVLAAPAVAVARGDAVVARQRHHDLDRLGRRAGGDLTVGLELGAAALEHVAALGAAGREQRARRRERVRGEGGVERVGAGVGLGGEHVQGAARDEGRRRGGAAARERGPAERDAGGHGRERRQQGATAEQARGARAGAVGATGGARGGG